MVNALVASLRLYICKFPVEPLKYNLSPLHNDVGEVDVLVGIGSKVCLPYSQSSLQHPISR